jgi:hypothetical protein
MKRLLSALAVAVALLSTTTLSVAKDKVIRVRVNAKWTTTETLSGEGSGTTWKGQASVESSYSQEYTLAYQGAGFLNLGKAEGPKTSNVTASTSGSMVSEAISSTGSFSGSGTAGVDTLGQWPADGKGLAFRFISNAALKGTCQTDMGAAGKTNACGATFPGGYGSSGGVDDTSDQAQHTYTLDQLIDVTSDPNVEAEALATASVEGSPKSGYHFTYSGHGTKELGFMHEDWNVSADVTITVITKTKH